MEFNWAINADGGFGGFASRAELSAYRHSVRWSRLRTNQPIKPLHVAHGLLQADHDCAGDDAVADVELVHSVDGGDGFHVAVGQAVTGVQRDAGGADLLAGFD